MTNSHRFTRAMKIIRRVHMFTGLFMVPWIVIYGLSALAFNHVSWFNPGAKSNTPAAPLESRSLDEIFWNSSPMTQVGIAQDLAQKYLDAINREADTNAAANGANRWQLADDEAKYSRLLVLEGRTGETNVELQLDLEERDGHLNWRTRQPNSAPKPKPAPGAIRRFDPADAIKLDADWLAAVRLAAQPAEATNSPLPGLRVKNAPELVFLAEAEGRQWNVRCNLTTGEVVAREAGAGGSTVNKTVGFMKRLHKTRGYPASGEVNVRWWWALIVDATASLLLIWAFTGLAMWWQMKGQRLWGAVTLAACGVAIWLIWTGMQSVFR